ncbi:hypothetical protein [Rhizosphaericola mali]|uniref:Uncharacterized protein n=1 Tax=Rhizosphaericola mali TaxID=2545455 RepID=A0A5P2FVT1_9BACT|nr:hypothetical protein [Rhizosphaericola mali]QES87616.1 hypothetical protein E0W69_002675 [Rhizosphaericola mali]
MGTVFGKRVSAFFSGATTFYAVQTQTGGYTWATASEIPSGYSCQSGDAACSVLSDNGTRPEDNTMPSGSNYHYTDTGKEYKPDL